MVFKELGNETASFCSEHMCILRGELLVGLSEEVVSKATLDVYFTFQKYRAEILVRVQDDKIRVVTQCGKEVLLNRSEIRVHFSPVE